MSHLPIVLGILLFSGAVLSAIDRSPESNQKALKQQTDAEWEEFKKTYEKSFYSDEHEEAHKEAFMKQLEVIKEQNEAFQRGETSFQFGVSSLSDMTADERDQLLGFRFDRPAPPPTRFMGKFANGGEVDVSRVPQELDWRKGNGSLHLVTSVKNQLHCGSCWAFSTVGALEAAHAKATGHLVDLSPQNLVDCDATNFGCQGGFPLMSLTFAIDQGGVNIDRAYPYVGVDAKCRFSNQKPVGASAVRQVVPLPVGDEKALMAALAQEGPISVAIQVTYNFMAYAGGVLNDRTCSSKMIDLNHAVLLVGYGTDPKWGDYWLVKNSWSTSWGENGYIRMARNKNNQCGIATQAVFARN